MRWEIFVASGLLAAMTAWADDNLPLLNTGSEVYSNVTILSATAADVYFTYNNGHGMANAKLKNLSPELQKHFHYNATNALTLEKKQNEANAQYHAYLVSHPAPPPPNEGRPAAPPPAAASAPEGSWRTDLPGALSRARSDNKLVLLDFTGSDWCSWCIKFDQDILSTDQFAGYAAAKLVLVKLDFPRHTPQSDDLKRANAELRNRFQVNGFPTYVLLNADGNELGRQVGYLKGGPNSFIAELDNFSKH
ncbi:MAG: thioredoxin family protein [Verrucomicrobiota bacterium]|jgi:protein disulfide-isomerase